MRLSGGSLDITSPGEGLGTTVTLQLPIEEQPQAKEVGKGHE
jgi:signal transduction histidine kinase